MPTSARDLKQPQPDAETTRLKDIEKTHLYFADKGNQFLISEGRNLERGDTIEGYGRSIIKALIDGPRRELMRTLPKETKLRAFYMPSGKTAYVDFSIEIGTRHPGGIQMERITLYSIVNSLILNLPEVDSVRILVGGRTAETLAGHMDLQFPLKAEMLLIR